MISGLESNNDEEAEIRWSARLSRELIGRERSEHESNRHEFYDKYSVRPSIRPTCAG
jgi:hypothetical protein